MNAEEARHRLRPGDPVIVVRSDIGAGAGTIQAAYREGADVTIGERGCWYVPYEDLQEPERGLRADILVSPVYGDCSAGGISSQVRQVTVLGIPDGQVSAPTREAPAVILVHRSLGGRDVVHAEPVERRPGIGPMMGGCYIATSDSRFGRAAGFYGAVALHDRFESHDHGGS